MVAVTVRGANARATQAVCLDHLPDAVRASTAGARQLWSSVVTGHPASRKPRK